MISLKKGKTYLDKVVKHTRVEGFGERVSGVTRLLHVQGHVDGFLGASPFTVHLPAGDLLLQTILVDSKQKGRKC